MNTVVGLPLPRLSYDRFYFSCKSREEAFCDTTKDSMLLLTDPDLFEKVGVRIAFSGREGGVSKPPFDTLNLGTHVDDDLQDVKRNRNRLLSALGAEHATLVVPNQVHGTDIVSIKSFDDVEKARANCDDGADGLIVECEDVAALLCFADCMPVMLVAPSGVFSVVHAGWRGVYGHIAVKALHEICIRSGCGPDECNAYLGPYIHKECFEVGADLAQKFESEFSSECIIGKNHVDMGVAMRYDLVSAGMQPNRIASAGICTVCNSQAYFSYRFAHGVCGRHGAIAIRIQ